MAVSKTTVTGPVYLPSCEKPDTARIVFELSSWDKQDGEASFVTGPYIGTIDEGGNFSVDLFTTTEGTNGAVYRAYVTYISADGKYHRDYMGYFTLSGPGPFKLSDLVMTDEFTVTEFDVLAECAAYALDAKNALSTVSSSTSFVNTPTTNAIQVAIDEVAAEGGGVVYLNPELIYEGTGFLIKSNVSVICHGSFGHLAGISKYDWSWDHIDDTTIKTAQIRATSWTENLVVFEEGAINAKLEGVSLDANRLVHSYVLYGRAQHNAIVNNVDIRRARQGFAFDSSSSQRLMGSTFTNITIYNMMTAINGSTEYTVIYPFRISPSYAGGAPTGLTISNIYVHGNIGVDYDAAADNIGTADQVSIQYIENSTVENVYSFHGGELGFFLDGNNCHVSNITAYGASKYGIQIGNAWERVISSNIIEGTFNRSIPVGSITKGVTTFIDFTSDLNNPRQSSIPQVGEIYQMYGINIPDLNGKWGTVLSVVGGTMELDIDTSASTGTHTSGGLIHRVLVGDSYTSLGSTFQPVGRIVAKDDNSIELVSINGGSFEIGMELRGTGLASNPTIIEMEREAKQMYVEALLAINCWENGEPYSTLFTDTITGSFGIDDVITDGAGNTGTIRYISYEEDELQWRVSIKPPNTDLWTESSTITGPNGSFVVDQVSNSPGSGFAFFDTNILISSMEQVDTRTPPRHAYPFVINKRCDLSIMACKSGETLSDTPIIGSESIIRHYNNLTTGEVRYGMSSPAISATEREAGDIGVTTQADYKGLTARLGVSSAGSSALVTNARLATNDPDNDNSAGSITMYGGISGENNIVTEFVARPESDVTELRQSLFAASLATYDLVPAAYSYVDSIGEHKVKGTYNNVTIGQTLTLTETPHTLHTFNLEPSSTYRMVIDLAIDCSTTGDLLVDLTSVGVDQIKYSTRYMAANQAYTNYDGTTPMTATIASASSTKASVMTVLFSTDDSSTVPTIGVDIYRDSSGVMDLLGKLSKIKIEKAQYV